MKQALSLATAAVSLFAGAAQLKADVITYVEGTDGYTHHGATVRNDGSNSTATNNSTRMLAGSVGSGALRALLSYDLAGIPAGATINSVTLTVGIEADTGASVPGTYAVELRSLSSAFDEATANWNTTFGAGTTLGDLLGSVAMSPLEASLTSHTYTSTASFVAAVQAALDANAPLNLALTVPSVEGGPNRVIMRMVSDEGDAVTQSVPFRPALSIDYTPIPEPASLALLTLGAAVALGRRH